MNAPHISDVDQAWARMFLGQDVYVQRFLPPCIAVWLRLGCGAHTIIGYGTPAEAQEQATRALESLAEQVMRKVAESQSA